jgi:hypothetical protein
MVKVKGTVIALGVGSGRGDEALLAGRIEPCAKCGKRHTFPLPADFQLKDAVEVQLSCGQSIGFSVAIDGRAELEFKRHQKALNKIEGFRRRFYKRVQGVLS